MPMIRGGHQTLVTYPDGDSKVITLFVAPVEGQIIAHGWEVRDVQRGDVTGSALPVEFWISVARPAGKG